MSYLIIVGLILVDQVFKYVFQGFDKVYLIKGILDFSPVKNYGVAFSMMNNKTILIILLNIILLFLIYKEAKANKLNTSIGYYLLMAGGISNLIDRIFRGYVLDFFDFFGIFIFNIADVFITFGLIIYLYNWNRKKL